MKALSLETTKLLDKMYNLRGKDSVVLVEMDKQKDKAEIKRKLMPFIIGGVLVFGATSLVKIVETFVGEIL